MPRKPTFHAYCYASGLIEFGRKVPDGAIRLTRGKDQAAVRDFIDSVARHGYKSEMRNGRLTKIPGTECFLVPGIPEAQNEPAKLFALQSFIAWMSPSAIKAGLSIDGWINPTEEEIAALPETFRPVMTERDEGLLYHEIATKLNIPIGTVRSRINRARARIIAMRADAKAKAEQQDRPSGNSRIRRGIELAKGAA